jgi:hypothetical protein
VIDLQNVPTLAAVAEFAAKWALSLQLVKTLARSVGFVTFCMPSPVPAPAVASTGGVGRPLGPASRVR